VRSLRLRKETFAEISEGILELHDRLRGRTEGKYPGGVGLLASTTGYGSSKAFGLENRLSQRSPPALGFVEQFPR
jgi:hypothetical protein